MPAVIEQTNSFRPENGPASLLSASMAIAAQPGVLTRREGLESMDRIENLGSIVGEGVGQIRGQVRNG